jgi:hypothetical protein
MQVLLGAATLFFCWCRVAGPGSQDLGFRIWVSGPGFQDLSLKTQTDTMVPLVVLFIWDCYSSLVASCCSSYLGLLLLSCCYDFFFLRTWLSGLGFQDLDRQTHTTHPTIVSSFSHHFFLRPVVTYRLRPMEAKCKAKNQRKERLRPLFFPEKNSSVCLSTSFVRLSVRADSAIENANRWSLIGRAGSAVKNATRTPNHPPMD